MKIEDVARICHEANRQLCIAHGDLSQLDWLASPDWQRESAIQGVKWRLSYPDAPCSAQHVAWSEAKVADGWVYGPTKDADKKTHPCLIPYDKLPLEQKLKDALFVAIVMSLRPGIEADAAASQLS